MVISQFLAVSRRYLFAPLCLAAVGLAHAADATSPAGVGVTNATGAAVSTSPRPSNRPLQPAAATGGTTTGGTTAGGTTAGGTTTGGTTTGGTTTSGTTTGGYTHTGDYMPKNHGEAKFVDRVEDRFSTFSGSDKNAESLALGLRYGKPITLTTGGATTGGATTGGTTTGSGASSGSVTFKPPTGHMGHGNVTRALTIAQRQLASYGIVNPTPEQLKAALVGGDISTGTGAGTGTGTGTGAKTVKLDGVLTLRSQGMGWGKIEHTAGIKHSGHGHYGVPPMGTGTGTQSGVGVTTAGGATAPGRHHPRHEHGPEMESHHRHGGSGVVNAGGTAAQPGRHDVRREDRGGEVEQHRSRGDHASRTGIVSASGATAPVSGRNEVRQEHRSGHVEARHHSRPEHAASASRSGIVSAGGAMAGGSAAAHGHHGHHGGRGATTVAAASSSATGSVTASGAGITSASGGGVVSAGGKGGGHGNGEHSGRGHK